jgi:hypothetical protein
MHFVFQEPTITASCPVYNNHGELIGVFGVDYLLSWMNDFLKNLLIGDNGSIYIVDQDDNLISSSIDMDHFSIDNGQINLINTNEIENQYIRKSKEAYQERKDKTIPTIKVDGQKYYVNKTEINHKNINWKAYYLIAENDFLANIKRASLY